MRLQIAVILPMLIAGLLAWPAAAEDLVWATGRVYTADGIRPLAGAVVAVYDDKNRVLDYAKTDANGDYTLAVPRGALHLGKKSGGFFHQVVRAVGDAGRVAALPLKAGLKAAASLASASDPLTKAGVGAASNLAQSLVDQMSPGDRGKKGTPARFMPGVLVVKVASPGHNDAVGLAGVYWMEEEVFRADGKERRALAAWLDPVHLTPAGSEKPSTVQSTYLTYTSARLEPSIAEPGQTVALTVTMPAPPEPRTPLVVVARNSRNGFLLELSPVGEGVYRGEFVVDKRFPKNDQVFCVLAYAQQEERPGRIKKVEDALNGAGLFNPDKPYLFNPLLAVSRNRAEVALTVVQPARRR